MIDITTVCTNSVLMWRVQISCGVRSYWKRTPLIRTSFIPSDTSYFVGIRIESVN